MMQGDSYRLPIEIKKNDGSTLESSDISALEVFIGGIRKTFPEDITYSEGSFNVPLSQKETFRLRGTVKLKIRCKFLSGDVIGIDAGEINITESTSKVVI